MSKSNELFREQVDEHDLFIEEENYQALLANDPAYEEWLEEMDNKIIEERENGFKKTESPF